MRSFARHPQPEVGVDRIAGTILYVDSFGNVALNVTREHVAEVGIVPGTQVELELGGERFFAVAARTFADARAGRHHALRGQLPEHVRRDQQRLTLLRCCMPVPGSRSGSTSAGYDLRQGPRL
jgi:hypothetical protein